MSTTNLLYDIGIKLFEIWTPILVVLGVVLNPICLIIYSREAFNKTTTGFYLRVLSVSDTVTIIVTLVFSFYYITSIDLKLFNDYGCKLVNYFYYAPPALSAWLEALVSIDRAFSVALPNRFKFRENRKFQWAVVICLALYNFLFYSCILVFFRIVPSSDQSDSSSNNTCTSCNQTSDTVNNCYIGDDEAQVLNWMDLPNSTLVPFALMIVSTVVIINKLRKSRRNLKHQTENKSESAHHQDSSHLQRTTALSLKNVSVHSESTHAVVLEKPRKRSHQRMFNNNKREQRDFSFAMTSVIINLVFIVLNIGYPIMNLIENFSPIETNLYMLVSGVVINLFYIDYMCKFFIYITFNSKFRKELKLLFTCGN